MHKLCDLKAGEKAQVVALRHPGGLRRRLLDIGLINGTEVECLGCSPLGDPKAYLIRGAVIAIRTADACEVEIS
jgi:ferrous iron transport protein A